MSKRQWLVLLMLFVVYLLLGASIFYHIESPLEAEKVKEARQQRLEINGLLHRHYMPHITNDHHEILAQLTQYCGKSVYNYTENEVDLYKWDFYNSFYFAYTVVSTIGYGNLAPTNMLGRILMIFYALIGIPINGILLAQLGEFFGNVFVQAHEKYKTYKDGHLDSPKNLTPLETGRAGLAVQIFMYLTPGFIMFIFFPAFLFSYWEGWRYDESVYYAFVTLSTIGFGDYVAGQDNTKGTGIFWIMYKIFLLFWISFGLGYLVMIMSFIARGMRSKRITRIEHKLAMNLKHTQSKIWNEFSKDVNYLRRVFNEVYLMKLKPVYNDEYHDDVPMNQNPRSSSFPDLRELIYGGFELDKPIHPRRRANSEVAQVTQYEPMNRVASETDLHRINKNATFATHAMVRPAELLAHLINAMGYIPPSSEEMETPVIEEDIDQSRFRGIDGFSDKEILSSERGWAGSGWKIGGEKMPPPRTRAASEIGLTRDYNGLSNHHNSEWTWSGPAASEKIQELMKARKGSAASESRATKSRIPSFSIGSVPKKIRPRWLNNPFTSKKNSAQPSRRGSCPIDDIETNLRENYLSHTTNTRPLRPQDRRRSAAPNYHTYTDGSLPNAPDTSLLEETSLADFLRALTTLHSRVGAVPEDYINRPQRKMGTASLTPPKLPSLLTLFSPPPGFNSQNHSNQSTVTAGHMAARRHSLRPAGNTVTSAFSYDRRDSFLAGVGPRKFSLKPEDNSGTSTPTYQRRGSAIPASRPRRFSLKNAFSNGGNSNHNSPQYTPDMVPLHVQERQNPPPYSADPFVFECPKEPLVSAEVRPAQDAIPHPLRDPPVPRRFSLRPAQIGVPPAPPSPKTPTMMRQVPKWKGGMLQRQISELNLQRRARAFSLGDVHSIKTDHRAVGQTSPLALPNATSNLSNRSISTTEKSEKTDSQPHDKIVTTVPSGILSSRKTDDARQTGGSIDQPSTGQILTDQTQVIQQNAVKAAPKHRIYFNDDERGSDEAEMPSSQTFNPFDFNIVEGQPNTEVSVPFDPPSAHKNAVHETASKKSLTSIKMDDGNMAVKLTGMDSSHSSELYSVLVDEPLSKMSQLYSGDNENSLTEVKVDSSGSVEETGAKKSTDSNLPSSRKISTISRTSTSGAFSDGLISTGRKTSAVSQQGIESGSKIDGRKSSTSKSGTDKPRVSIDSYKPLMELKIEKPATNPFEKYKATVEYKFDKPRDKTSNDHRKTSTEMKIQLESQKCEDPEV